MNIKFSEISSQEIIWKNTNLANELTASVEGRVWMLRINPDFPLEDMYTLKIANETFNFNVWPIDWFMPDLAKTKK